MYCDTVFLSGFREHTGWDSSKPSLGLWSGLIEKVSDFQESPEVVVNAVRSDVKKIFDWWRWKKAARWGSVRGAVLALYKVNYRKFSVMEQPVSDCVHVDALPGVSVRDMYKSMRVLRNSGLLDMSLFTQASCHVEMQNVVDRLSSNVKISSLPRSVYRRSMQLCRLNTKQMGAHMIAAACFWQACKENDLDCVDVICQSMRTTKVSLKRVHKTVRV